MICKRNEHETFLIIILLNLMCIKTKIHLNIFRYISTYIYILSCTQQKNGVDTILGGVVAYWWCLVTKGEGRGSRIRQKVITKNVLILCHISAEFYLTFKFIIIKIMYSNCSITNTCDLFSKIFKVFNEMEIEINVINNEIFTKL